MTDVSSLAEFPAYQALAAHYQQIKGRHLRDLFAQHKLSKRVRLGVANQRIVMRAIDLPPLTDAKEIASAVRFFT